MARTVQEIMNRELLSVSRTEPALDTLRTILSIGITGVSVLDDDGRPIGIATLRDLVQADQKTVADAMTSPVETIAATATIDAAARRLAETGRHRLVAVDSEGRAVGMVSALDVVRGLLGLPAVHPPAFPHFDPTTGLSWTDDVVLTDGAEEAAPSGPGVLVLVHGGAGIRERVVWVETCNDVRLRLLELMNIPQSDEPRLARALRTANLRFRAATCPDEALRKRAAEIVQGQAMAALSPAPRGSA